MRAPSARANRGRTVHRMTQTQILYAGLSFGEGPRWHDGRLWVSDFHTHRVLAIDETGTAEMIVEVPNRPSGLGWLPDGRLLVVSMTDRKLMRLDPGGLVDARGPRRPRHRRLQRHGRRCATGARTSATSGTTSPAGRSCEQRRSPRHTRWRRVGRGRGSRVPERDRDHAGWVDAHPRRDVRTAAHRVRHRRRRLSLESTGLGRARQRHARRHLPRRGGRRSGLPIRRTPSASVSSRVARSPIASRPTRAALRACSAARIVGRCT